MNVVEADLIALQTKIAGVITELQAAFRLLNELRVLGTTGTAANTTPDLPWAVEGVVPPLQIPRQPPMQTPVARRPELNSITGAAHSRWCIPFGKYKGEMIGNLPSDYLQWCIDNMTQMRDDARLAITAELQERAGRSKL